MSGVGESVNARLKKKTRSKAGFIIKGKGLTVHVFAEYIKLDDATASAFRLECIHTRPPKTQPKFGTFHHAAIFDFIVVKVRVKNLVLPFRPVIAVSLEELQTVLHAAASVQLGKVGIDF